MKEDSYNHAATETKKYLDSNKSSISAYDAVGYYIVQLKFQEESCLYSKAALVYLLEYLKSRAIHENIVRDIRSVALFFEETFINFITEEFIGYIELFESNVPDPQALALFKQLIEHCCSTDVNNHNTQGLQMTIQNTPLYIVSNEPFRSKVNFSPLSIVNALFGFFFPSNSNSETSTFSANMRTAKENYSKISELCTGTRSWSVDEIDREKNEAILTFQAILRAWYNQALKKSHTKNSDYNARFRVVDHELAATKPLLQIEEKLSNTTNEDEPSKLLNYQLSLIIAVHKESYSHAAMLLGNLGEVYKNLGNKLKSLELYKRAYYLSKFAYGPEHSKAVACYNIIQAKAPKPYHLENELKHFIVKYGTPEDLTIQVELKIMSNVLIPIQSLAAKNNWSQECYVPFSDIYIGSEGGRGILK